MAFIKTALEIAMERTKDVKSDPKTLKLDNLLKDGRKLASEFLNDSNFKKKELGKKLESFKGENKKSFKEGLKKTLLSNITLPKTEFFEKTLGKIHEGLITISSNEKDINEMIEQIKQFFMQYLENRKQLIEAIKQQYGPRLIQKQQELAKQYGHEVNISPEQDPEFMELLKSNISKLETQYGDSLLKAKEELGKIL
jgi:hypothetical protein